MAIRVLIVDDSGFFRRRLTEIFSTTTQFEIVGAAENGREAVELTLQLKPDVITMDYEMPIMDGISAVKQIMAQKPTPILMFSSLTYEGAKITLDALEAGAVDFLPKNFEEISRNSSKLRRTLFNKLKAVAGSSRNSAIPYDRNATSDESESPRETPREPMRKPMERRDFSSSASASASSSTPVTVSVNRPSSSPSISGRDLPSTSDKSKDITARLRGIRDQLSGGTTRNSTSPPARPHTERRSDNELDSRTDLRVDSRAESRMDTRARTAPRGAPEKRTGAEKTEIASHEHSANAEHAGSMPAKAKNRKTFRGKCDVVLIGTSTGGPVALTKVLTALPSNFPIPIVLVQHMPGNFTKAFAERLDTLCNIRIKEAVTGDSLNKGVALLAPGGMQMMIDRQKRIRILPGDSRVNYKPSVDITFGSAANSFGGNVLGIILTGMGSDGRDGSRLLKSMGAMIWAQDEESSVIYGMPMAVAKANLADEIVSLSELSDRLVSEFM